MHSTSMSSTKRIRENPRGCNFPISGPPVDHTLPINLLNVNLIYLGNPAREDLTMHLWIEAIQEDGASEWLFPQAFDHIGDLAEPDRRNFFDQDEVRLGERLQEGRFGVVRSTASRSSNAARFSVVGADDAPPLLWLVTERNQVFGTVSHSVCAWVFITTSRVIALAAAAD
jgi:hypothetical protein